jgi:hypothetical protein
MCIICYFRKFGAFFREHQVDSICDQLHYILLLLYTTATLYHIYLFFCKVIKKEIFYKLNLKTCQIKAQTMNLKKHPNTSNLHVIMGVGIAFIQVYVFLSLDSTLANTAHL